MKPYNREQSTKQEEIREMFDTIAPKYDRINHVLSMQIDKIWRRRVVKIASRVEHSVILDLATGTGDLLIAMAQKMPQARFIGVDLSEGMLSIAKEKIARVGIEDRVELKCGVAESLDIPSQSVDVVTVAFGVRNFEDLKRGLSEMTRVVKRGGHIIILEFSTPDNPLFRWGYNIYSRHILPRIGGLMSKDRRAYDYLPASVEEFLTPAQMVEMMQSVGLTECKVRSQSLGIARIYIAKRG